MANDLRCLAIFIAQGTGKRRGLLYIAGIMTSMSRPTVPVTEGPFHVVSYWKGTREKAFDYIVRVRGPHGQPIEEEAYDAKIGPYGSAFFTAEFAGLEFREYGEYVFEILQDGEVKCSEVFAVLPVA